MDLNWVIFGIGCLGAAAPEIVRYYRAWQENLDLPVPPWILSGSFVALGGVVALLLPAVTWWGAFYAGAASPTLISRMVAKPPQPGPPGTLGSRDRRPLSLRDYMSLI